MIIIADSNYCSQYNDYTDLQTWVHGDHDLSLIEDAMDHHSYIHSCSGCEKEVSNKSLACMGVKPMISVLKIIGEILLAVCSISTSVQMITSCSSRCHGLVPGICNLCVFVGRGH